MKYFIRYTLLTLLFFFISTVKGEELTQGDVEVIAQEFKKEMQLQYPIYVVMKPNTWGAFIYGEVDSEGKFIILTVDTKHETILESADVAKATIGHALAHATDLCIASFTHGGKVYVEICADKFAAAFSTPQAALKSIHLSGDPGSKIRKEALIHDYPELDEATESYKLE